MNALVDGEITKFKGNWECGSLEMEWEKNIEIEITKVLDSNVNQQDTMENNDALPFENLLDHTWLNTDETGLSRPSRLEVPIAKDWKLIEGTAGAFYYHRKSRTCTWTQPYNLPDDIPILEHIPPLGVFARQRSRNDGEKLTEDNEDDGFQKQKVWKKKQDGVHEFSVTPGKSAISLLHEFSLNVLRTGPEFLLSYQEDPQKPFVTTICIKGKEYGIGCYSNKKQSKQIAAENALETLCPGVYPVAQLHQADESRQKEIDAVVEQKKDLLIDDERVLLLGQMDKTPAQILQEYCNREGVTIEWDEEDLKNDLENRFRVHAIISGDKVCYGEGKTKKEGKQKAAQQFLKMVHPNIHSWTELLKLYAQTMDKSKEPTSQLLITLKEEMRKAIETQSYCTFIDNHPDAYFDGSEGTRIENDIDMELS